MCVKLTLQTCDIVELNNIEWIEFPPVKILQRPSEIASVFIESDSRIYESCIWWNSFFERELENQPHAKADSWRPRRHGDSVRKQWPKIASNRQSRDNRNLPLFGGQFRNFRAIEILWKCSVSFLVRKSSIQMIKNCRILREHQLASWHGFGAQTSDAARSFAWSLRS